MDPQVTFADLETCAVMYAVMTTAHKTPQCEGVKQLHAAMHPSVAAAIKQLEGGNQTMAEMARFGFGRYHVRMSACNTCPRGGPLKWHASSCFRVRWAMNNQLEFLKQQEMYPLDR